MTSGADVRTPSRTPRFSATKFAPPAVSPLAIVRPDLIAALDRAAVRGLGLVVGSAGAGKTNLLLQWVESRPSGETCWMNVDESDRDPVRFWHAVVQAFQSVRFGFGREALDLMANDHAFGADAFESLVDELDDVDPPITLILDDLHLVDATEVSLHQLIGRRPRGLRLVIGSRADPRIDLGRLRAGEVLVEVRDEDLRLQRHEASAVLGSLGIAVADADLDLLMEQTEGWATGIHLAGVALGRAGDPSDFISRLVTSSDVIAHYLSSEVLEAQSPEVQRFMLGTCVADELTPDLAAALSGGSPISLDSVESAHLMLSRNSARPDVFRYHHLLLQLLRLRLRAHDPERERRLHRIAADWYEADGDLAACFRHRWRAGDRDEAMRLLARNVYDAYLANRLPPISPNDFVLTDDDVLGAPGPAIGVATTLCLRHHRTHADRLVRRIERLAGDRLDDTERVDLLCVRTLLVAGACDMEATVEHAATLATIASRAGLRGDAIDLTATMAIRAHAWAGDWTAAETVARRVTIGEGPSVVAIELHGALAKLEIFRGNLQAGIDHARRTRDLIAASDLSGLSPVSPAIALEGYGLLERGDVTTAESLFRQLNGAEEHTRLPSGLIADLGLSRLAHARGDVGGALALLEAARARVSHLDETSWVVAAINARTARQLLGAGAFDRCAVVIEQLPTGTARDLAQSAVLRSRGDLAGAGTHIECAAEGADCLRAELDVALARVALVLAAGDDPDGAAEAAISIAGREGFVFALAEAGGEVLRSIQDRARRMARTDFVDAVLRIIPHVPAEPRAALVVDELSEREQAVLRYLVTSLSYREIADELFVSVNTVKTHVKSVFRKLHAASRDEVLARARALGYL